jgi:hypothetical protein
MNQNTFCSKCHRIPSQCCCNTAQQTNIKFNQTLECPSYLSGLAPRELSDEEIMSEWEQSKDEVDFARAILKKASEK